VQVQHQTAIDIQTSVQAQHKEKYKFRHLCKCNIKEHMSSPQRLYDHKGRRFFPGAQTEGKDEDILAETIASLTSRNLKKNPKLKASDMKFTVWQIKINRH
jgi:hypothetical protein